MAIYTVSFRPTDTGLAGTLVFPTFVKLSDGTAPTNAAPGVFIEIALGLYKFTYVAAEEVVFILDGGVAIPSTNRYVSGVLSPVDTNLDAAISTRAPAATALSTAQWTNTRATNLDNLDTSISSRAASATALNTAQWTNTRATNLDNLDAAISSRADQVTSTQLRRLTEGRWKIFTSGPDANRLVLYSFDGSTVLQKWDLKDNLGNPTTSNIFERVPTNVIP